jgi:phosphatidate cytidylyltransferase
MLKQRVITAVILLAALLLVLFGLPAVWFGCISAVVVLVASLEWANLAGLEAQLHKGIYLVAILVGLVCVYFVPILILLAVTCLFWLLALFWVVCYPKLNSWWSSKACRVVMGFFVLVPCWYALNVLRQSNSGAWLVLFLLLLVWASDIGAYFAGRWWGKHKLMPQVSPGKTWEGFIGGFLLSLIVAMVALYIIFHVNFSVWLTVFVLVVFVNIFSVVGDLFESMLKRHRGIKDSSNILPGHGGILDRIDSLTAAAPIFTLGLVLYLFYMK